MSDEPKKEKRLQAALRSDDTQVDLELERIYQQHHQRVVQAAFRVTGNASDAEDVLQTVFLRLLRRGDPPNRSENLGSYLHRAAVNASIDLLRSRSSRKKVALEDVQTLLMDTPEASPDWQQAAKELQSWLRSAIAEMSPQAAEIFSLRYLEGYRNQEIADLVGTSPGVVAVVLHRTRHRLRDEIRSLLGEEL